jgi:RNA polymerase sigma-70 factor (ECF subfamily)
MHPSSEVAPDHPVDEIALVQRAQRGDLAAFNELVTIHERAVFNLCLRVTGDRASAEDGAQEAFIAAWRGVRTFHGTSFRPWIMRIAVNACTDELRRRARRPAVSLDAPPPGAPDPIEAPDPGAGPETQTLRREHQRALEAALVRLPHDQRVAVVLCDVQGYSYEEIAETTRASLGTVKSRIARGREKLRGLLGSMLEQMGE